MKPVTRDSGCHTDLLHIAAGDTYGNQFHINCWLCSEFLSTSEKRNYLTPSVFMCLFLLLSLMLIL